MGRIRFGSVRILSKVTPVAAGRFLRDSAAENSLRDIIASNWASLSSRARLEACFYRRVLFGTFFPLAFLGRGVQGLPIPFVRPSIHACGDGLSRPMVAENEKCNILRGEWLNWSRASFTAQLIHGQWSHSFLRPRLVIIVCFLIIVILLTTTRWLSA